MATKKISNYIKSIPTRIAARKEYNNDHYKWDRVGGSQPIRIKRTPPLKTYNRATTGIRGKKK